MTLPGNPYQPSRSNAALVDRGDHHATQEIVFGGVITAQDFAAMIPHRSFIWFLLALVTPLCVLSAFAALAVALAELNRSAWTIPLLLAVGAVLVGMPIGVYQLLAAKRASRILRRRPDLLGTVQGSINEEGMLLNDGLRRHWFAALTMRQSRVLKSGIRVRLNQDPYHFLALSTRLFDNFDARQMKSWIRHWQSQAKSMSMTEHPLACTTRLGVPPPDAIDFSGQVKLQMPTDTPESRRQAWSLTVQLIVAIIVLIAAFASEPGRWNGFTLITLIATILYAWAVFAMWRLVRQGVKLQTITQSGWISQSELLIESEGNASRCPISCFQIQPIPLQGVIWLVGEVGMIAITKDILATSDDWQQLLDWFGKPTN